MLAVLSALRSHWDLTLHAAHFHHGLRDEADADAEFVTLICERFDVPVRIERGDVGGDARRMHRNIHEAARTARNGFLRRAAAEIGADVIALAHTGDDRVETILQNLFRGTGLAGLCAMPPREGDLVRPMLDATRAMTGSYCRAAGIVPRRDVSNRSLRYTRTRMRAELLPYVEAHINPRARQAVLRMAELLTEDHAHLEQEASQAFERHVRPSRQGGYRIPCDEMELLPPALRTRVLRQMIGAVAGSDADVTADDVRQILAWAEARACANRQMASGVTVTVGDDVTVAASSWPETPMLPPRELPVPGCVSIPELGVHYCAEELTLSQPPMSVRAEAVVLPTDAVSPPLTIRGVHAGDRIRPLGMSGSKSVADHLRDAHVGSQDRRRFTLLADARGVLWLPGVCVDERGRIASVPCRALLVRRSVQPAED